MGRIVTTVVLVALAAVMTATYGNEVSQELQKKLRENPEKVCEILAPFSDAVAKLSVPFGAQHPKEVVWRGTAPQGFHSVLALMQVVNIAPCSGQKGEIAIRAIRLIERNGATGNETVVSEVTDFSDLTGKTQFKGELFSRLPSWYSGGSSQPNDKTVKRDGKELVINLAEVPTQIYHGWTEPQVSARPGMNYLVEMEVKISGSVRLQMGIDYWRKAGLTFNGWDGTCQKSNNCEGYLSNWYGPTDGYQTIRVPSALMK